jgi:hypothetical protein
MGSIYGDSLAFFAEQFRIFDYFSMQALPVASCSKRVPLGKIKGVFQHVKKGDLIRENDTEADVNVPTIWTRTKLKVGNFIEMDDEVYRITSDYTWKFEGGFYCYSLETFVGNSDEQTPFEDVNIGQNSYD